MIKFRDVIRALLPTVLYEEEDGTFSAIDPDRKWQVGNKQVTEQDLVDAVNREMKEIDDDPATEV